MRHVACNLCGADAPRLLFTSPDRTFPKNPQRYSVQQCQRCGLIYLSPQPDTDEEMALIYPPQYESYVKENRGLFMTLRRRAWLPELRELVHITTPTSPILELGGATGEFLAELQSMGRPDVHGLEWNASAAAMARSRYQLDVQSVDLFDAHFADAAFDVVVLRHVLEHVPDAQATLREIHRILRPTGYCIFTIPNVDSHSARLFGEYWLGYDVPRHFYTFRPQTATRLLQETGFEVAAIKQLPLPNVWISSMRTWLHARGWPRLAEWFRYTNPVALALFTPLGWWSATQHASGTIRVLARKPR